MAWRTWSKSRSGLFRSSMIDSPMERSSEPEGFASLEQWKLSLLLYGNMPSYMGSQARCSARLLIYRWFLRRVNGNPALGRILPRLNMASIREASGNFSIHLSVRRQFLDQPDLRGHI